jgi:hypothetical protein
VVRVGEDRVDESDDGGLVGGDAHDAAASLDLLVDPFGRVRRPDLHPVRAGEPGEREHVGPLSISVAIFGKFFGNWSRIWS